MWLSYLCIITALPFFTCVPISYSYKDFWKLYDYPLKLALLNLNNILKALSEVRLYLGVRNFNIWNLWWLVAKSCLTLATPPTVARPAPLSTWNLCTCVLRCSSCIQLFVTLWIIACWPPLSMGFPRQEYWSGLPCFSPGDLPNSRTEPVSFMSPALAGRFFTTSDTWEAHMKFGNTQFSL